MKNNYFVILIIILGCAYKPGKMNQTRFFTPELSTYTFLSDDPDKLFLDIYILIPNRNLVFIKHPTNFVSSLGISIIIKDKIDNQQIEHFSWTHEPVEKYYEDTRSDSKRSVIYHRFELHPGDYRIFANVRDKDSNRNWTLEETATLNKFSGFSEIITSIWDVDSYVYTGGNISGEADSIFCSFQLNIPEIQDSMNIQVIHQETENLVVEQSLELHKNNSEFMYKVAVPVDVTWGIDPILKFQISDFTKELELDYKHHSVESYWENPSLALEIMAFYLPVTNYKELKKKSDHEKLLYIAQFWKERDPDPKTKENELMIEFHTRVMYSIEHFSNLGPGWRSDRGRIYIDNGSPSFTELSQPNEKGYTYLVWYYPSGKQYVFIDENGFGDFRLIREVN